jgi:hypothetical protein
MSQAFIDMKIAADIEQRQAALRKEFYHGWGYE